MFRSRLFSGLWTYVRCTIEFILLAPLILFITVFVLRSTPAWPFLLSLLADLWIGVSLHRFVTNNRGLLIPIGVVVSGLAAVGLSGIGWQSIIVFLMLLIGYIRSVHIERFPTNGDLYELSIAGILVHFVGFFVFLHVPRLLPWTQALMVTGTLSVLILLLKLNANQVAYLKFGSRGSQSVPPSVTRLNRYYTLLMFVVAILLTGFGWIYRWVDLAWRWLASLIKFPQGKATQLPTQPSKPKLPPFKLPPGHATHSHGSSLWTHILMIIIAVLVSIALVWGLVVAARKILIALQTYLREPPPPAFVDEQESLRKRGWLGEDGLNLKRWLESLRKREPKWHELKNNRLRVRYIYRNMLRRAVKQGFTHNPALTPDETARDIAAWRENEGEGSDLERLIELYREARYAERDVTASDLEQLRDRLT